MQTIAIYINAHDTLGIVRDYANARNMDVPSLTRDVSVLLKLRLFADDEIDTAYPIAQLQTITSWQFVMDDDFNKQSTPPIIADNANIVLSSVSETINDVERTYTQVAVPIPDMNSQELIELLGNNEQTDGLIGELVGFDANAGKAFICQIKGFSVRNLVYDTGTPTEVEPTYLNASQVRALIAAGMVLQFSVDGTAWHDTQASTDAYWRMRSASDQSAAWSGAIAMVPGPQGQQGTPGTNGTDGANAYVYVRYASDNTGSDFSDAPSATRKYIAVKQTTTPIAEPAPSDFAGLWQKYLGDDGTGTGDMLKSTYDTDNNGKVDMADEADKAVKLKTARNIGDADFDGTADITLEDMGAAHEYHSHSTDDIANPAMDKVYSDNSNSLYINRGITRRTNSASGNLAIDITAIKNADGTAATISQEHCYTWELHVRATGNITSITVGSVSSTMSAVSIPDQLPLINGSTTYHVFTIRGFYKASAVNQIDMHVNYAYSYEA